MMSIGSALTAATTLVGYALPAGLIGERPQAPVLHGERGQELAGTASAEGALFEAVEAGLREAGYLQGIAAALAS